MGFFCERHGNRNNSIILVSLKATGYERRSGRTIFRIDFCEEHGNIVNKIRATAEVWEEEDFLEFVSQYVWELFLLSRCVHLSIFFFFELL